jgi:ribosomal protein S27E
MTTARVTCRQCGDVEVPIKSGHLVADVSLRESRAALRYECPTCGSVGVQPLEGRAVSLLLSAGISIVAPSSTPDSVGETHTSG